MLKYEIPFDKKVYAEQTRLTLPYVCFVERKKVKESLILAVVFIVIGLVILIAGSDLSMLFFSVSVFMVFDLHNKSENYKAHKDAYMRAVKNYLKDGELVSDGIFEFTEDCLRFSNDYLCSWTYWEDFKTFKVIKSNLLLIKKEKHAEVLVIGKSEVTVLEFQEILDFVSEKIE